ncbi:MAG: transcriptional regulator, GntR family [Eubacterium sp.]|nr:transcriptional regulator, GntR family [Eubacterium sp.]
MLNENSPFSLYYQLKQILIKKIKDNEWKVDSKIPTERELCTLYNVSRITVRQALEELAKEGYLYRKQGKGTFVTLPQIEQRLNKFYSFSEEIRNLGLSAETKIIDFRTIVDNGDIAEILGLEKHQKIYAVSRLRLADKEPFTFETSYIPFDMVEGLSKEEVENYGLYNTLKNTFNIVPDEATETFEAIIVPNDCISHLKVKKNSAALKIERVTKAQERVVEYCVSIIRGDRYKYKVYLK